MFQHVESERAPSEGENLGLFFSTDGTFSSSGRNKAERSTYSRIVGLLRWNPDSGGFSGPMLGVVCGAQS